VGNRRLGSRRRLNAPDELQPLLLVGVTSRHECPRYAGAWMSSPRAPNGYRIVRRFCWSDRIFSSGRRTGAADVDGADPEHVPADSDWEAIRPQARPP